MWNITIQEIFFITITAVSHQTCSGLFIGWHGIFHASSAPIECTATHSPMSSALTGSQPQSTHPLYNPVQEYLL